ncbi:MAG: NUDIX domain-containing protein [Myxococcota bacterium]
MTETDPPTPPRTPLLYGLGTSVYAERDGKILVLKRAGGAAPGAWYTPGGVLDPGETPAVCARRELLEETGLVPTGPLELVGLIPMHVYGAHSFLVAYACECKEGEVRLSHEHTAFRWVDALEYRERYFSEAGIDTLRAREPEIAKLSASVRQGIDEYLAFRGRT